MDDSKFETYLERRERELGFKPQTEVVYNSNLPYSEHLDNESEYALTVIKTNLSKVVLQGELRTGVTYWANQLTRYIRLYGLKFSAEDHVLFIKLLYEVVIIPDLECVIVECLCTALLKLLKKRELLNGQDLQLDWVPLHKLVERICYSKFDSMGLEWIPRSMEAKLRVLVRNCRTYFAPEATQDMLDEWRPLICPFDVVVSKALKLLDMFLPTLVYNDAERNASWKIWMDEFLTIWKSIQNGPSWEKHFVTLFARLAHNNIGHIDWNDSVGTLFTRLLRALSLPVGKLQQTAALATQLPIDSCCLWIISMIGGSATKIVLQNLKRLLEATATFFHPSNLGKWSNHLLQLLQSITTKFMNRVNRERYKVKKWEAEIPETHLISDADIEEFVEILKPATLLTLYSKLGAIPASKVLQHLAYLRADLVMPNLLDKTYIALGTLTEPHQVKACLTALCSCINPALNGYPEFRKHVIPLLFQCLPALDPNDLPKSTIAFQFISTCLTLIPFVDCSTAPQFRPEMSENDKAVCFMTSQLEDFVIQFFDRCFVLLESMNQGVEMTRESFSDTDLLVTQSEGLSGMIIVTATTMALQQSSKNIFNMCLNKLFQFATTHLFEGSIAMSTAATMCAVTAKADAAVSFAKFIPHYCQEVIAYFEDNPDARNHEKIDKQLMWDMKILSEICHVGTHHLLQYKDSLFQIVQYALELTAKEGYEAGVRIIKFCLRGWTLIYTHDRKSVAHDIDCDPSSYLALDDWGATIPPWKAHISWHVPTEEELEAAFEVLNVFMKPALAKLIDFTEGKLELEKEELQKTLYTVKELLRECYLILPVDSSEIVNLQEETSEHLKSWPVKTIETLPFFEKVLSKDDRRSFRATIFEVVRETLKKMMSSREDDVESVCMIIDIYSHCFLMHEQLKSEFDQQWKVFSTYKMAMQSPFKVKKKRDRFTHVDRSVLQQRMRILAVERSAYTPMHHNIMLDLILLSVSHYMKVRGNAQALFFHGLSLVPHVAYKEYLPFILKNFDKNENVGHQEFKGALYLLIGQVKSRNFLGFYQKWDAFGKAWPALINAPHTDKPSIAKLYEKLALKIQSNYLTIAIHYHLTEGAVQAACELLQSKSHPPALKVNTEMSVEIGKSTLKNTTEYNLSLYHDLVNNLVDLYESGKLTWKYSELVLGMISLLLRHDVDIPVRVSALFTACLVDDAISVRTLAIGCMGSILKQQKRKHVVEMLSVSEITSGKHSALAEINPGDREDNGWHHFNPEGNPDTEEKFSNMKFVDKTHWGYYCWPKQLKTYASYDKQPKLDRQKSELVPAEVPIFESFRNEGFVKQLVDYLCLENQKGKDKFDFKRMDMFRGLFRNFGDTFVPYFQAHIEQLVTDKHESNQRGAAEIITGIVMGSKHWSFDKVTKMWEWLIPALRNAISNISVETLKDWDNVFSHIVQNRDPRRIHWVLDFLVNEPMQTSNSALVESSRLYVLQGGIHQQEWRAPFLLQKIQNHIEPMLGHPYKNIRNRIGSLLASLFLYDVQLMGKPQDVRRTPSVDALIERVLPRLDSLMLGEMSSLGCSSTSAGSLIDYAKSTPDVEDFSISHGTADAVSIVEHLSADTLEQIQKRMKEMLPPGSMLPELSSLSSHIQNRATASLLKLQKSSALDDGVRTPAEDYLIVQVLLYLFFTFLV